LIDEFQTACTTWLTTNVDAKWKEILTAFSK
jgi:hypothetical protein